MGFRYKLYGMKPAQHSNDNSDTRRDDQKLTNVVEVYETNDRAEAKKLVEEGGFVSPTEGYVVVQGAVDTKRGGTIGLVPEVKQ